MRIRCANCRRGMNVPDRLAGGRVPCPACRSVLRVPAESPATGDDADRRGDPPGMPVAEAFASGGGPDTAGLEWLEVPEGRGPLETYEDDEDDGVGGEPDGEMSVADDGNRNRRQGDGPDEQEASLDDLRAALFGGGGADTPDDDGDDLGLEEVAVVPDDLDAEDPDTLDDLDADDLDGPVEIAELTLDDEAAPEPPPAPADPEPEVLDAIPVEPPPTADTEEEADLSDLQAALAGLAVSEDEADEEDEPEPVAAEPDDDEPQPVAVEPADDDVGDLDLDLTDTPEDVDDDIDLDDVMELDADEDLDLGDVDDGLELDADDLAGVGDIEDLPDDDELDLAPEPDDDDSAPIDLAPDETEAAPTDAAPTDIETEPTDAEPADAMAAAAAPPPAPPAETAPAETEPAESAEPAEPAEPAAPAADAAAVDELRTGQDDLRKRLDGIQDRMRELVTGTESLKAARDAGLRDLVHRVDDLEEAVRSGDDDKMRERLDALEDRVQTATDLAERLDAVESRTHDLDQIAERLDAVEKAADSTPDHVLERLDAVEKAAAATPEEITRRLDAVEKAAASTPDEITECLDAVEKAAASAPDDISALEARLEELAERIPPPAPPVAAEPVDDEVDRDEFEALARRVADLADALAARPDPDATAARVEALVVEEDELEEAVEALTGRLDGIESALQDLRDAAAAEPAPESEPAPEPDPRIATLEQGLDDLRSTVADLRDEMDAAPVEVLEADLDAEPSAPDEDEDGEGPAARVGDLVAVEDRLRDELARLEALVADIAESGTAAPPPAADAQDEDDTVQAPDDAAVSALREDLDALAGRVDDLADRAGVIDELSELPARLEDLARTVVEGLEVVEGADTFEVVQEGDAALSASDLQALEQRLESFVEEAEARIGRDIETVRAMAADAGELARTAADAAADAAAVVGREASDDDTADTDVEDVEVVDLADEEDTDATDATEVADDATPPAPAPAAPQGEGVSTAAADELDKRIAELHDDQTELAVKILDLRRDMAHAKDIKELTDRLDRLEKRDTSADDLITDMVMLRARIQTLEQELGKVADGGTGKPVRTDEDEALGRWRGLQEHETLGHELTRAEVGDDDPSVRAVEELRVDVDDLTEDDVRDGHDRTLEALRRQLGHCNRTLEDKPHDDLMWVMRAKILGVYLRKADLGRRCAEVALALNPDNTVARDLLKEIED